VSEGMRIEGLFKSLHKGIYTYGEAKLKEAVKLGYIESTAGFKLHLPNFEDFAFLYEKVNKFRKEDWTRYKEGKAEHKKKEEDKKYEIVNKVSYDFYQSNKGYISKYFKLRSKYFRLCLNNPTQTTAAHQTKRAACLLFDFIKKNNHINRARICIIPHDEFVLEVEDELVPLYEEKLGYFMREAGNEFIVSDIIRMEADAKAGNNWYEAK
jgi:DNA polymerase I-like protein with 3'-5' exonuclease and polymerase domains